MDERERAGLAIDGLLAEIDDAKRDPGKFFDFCFRDPKTRERIRASAIQRFCFEFALAHRFAVFRLPTDTGKSLFTWGLGLYLVGEDPSLRVLMASAIQDLAMRPITMMRDYMEDAEISPRVQAVFPNLRRGSATYGGGSPWTTTKLTVERPRGSPEATFMAIGLDSKRQQSIKVDVVIADDLLNDENTITPEQRDAVYRRFNSGIRGRLPSPTKGVGRCYVVNVPWNRDDITYRLEHEEKWPTVEADIYGNVYVNNAAEDYDTDLLRPSKRGGKWHRLTAHDPDPDEQVPLFPECWPLEAIEELRYGDQAKGVPGIPSREFAQKKLCRPPSDSDERCPQSYLDGCHVLGLELVERYAGPNVVISGFDLGFGKKSKLIRRHKRKPGLTVQFTYEVREQFLRRVLCVRSWESITGPALVRQILATLVDFGGYVVVESNAAQKYVREFAVNDPSFDHQAQRLIEERVISHETDRSKHDPFFGVESLFGELELKQWEIPCDRRGNVSRELSEWEKECRGYSPLAHTGDRLMAWWVARFTEHRLGAAHFRAGGTRALSELHGQRLVAARGKDPLARALLQRYGVIPGHEGRF